jgi:hypothetical protein
MYVYPLIHDDIMISKSLTNDSALAVRRLKEAVLRLLTEEGWFSRKAGLQIARLMLEYGFDNNLDRVIEESMREQLEHPEARVRQEAGEVLGAMTKLKNGGLLVWNRFGPALMALIEDTEERRPKRDGEDGGSDESKVYNPPKPNSLMHDTEGWLALDSSLRAIQHIIEGFNNRNIVDSPLKDSSELNKDPNLKQSTDSASTPSSTSINNGFPLNTRLIEMILRLLKHQNRFVRETAYMVISALFTGEAKRMKNENGSSLPITALDDISVRLASIMRDGLMDDFSHVIYAASNASRSFVLYLKMRSEFELLDGARSAHRNDKNLNPPNLPIPASTSSLFSHLMHLNDSDGSNGGAPSSSETSPLPVMPSMQLFSSCLSILLPALCLNRYVSQDGLRTYSIQTWKMLVHQEGPKLVSYFLPQIISFYASLSSHHNASIRETTAHCLGELMKKVERARGQETATSDSSTSNFNASIPFQIRGCLAMLVQDHSWPVRDAASSSISNFLLDFCEPNNSGSTDPFNINELYTLLVQRLSDPLASVRETASTSMISLLGRLASPTQSTPASIFSIKVRDVEFESRIIGMKMKEGGKGDGDDSDSGSDSDDSDHEKSNAKFDGSGDSDDDNDDLDHPKSDAHGHHDNDHCGGCNGSSLDSHHSDYNNIVFQLLQLIEARLNAFIGDDSVNEIRKPTIIGSSSFIPTSISSTDTHFHQSGESYFGPVAKMIHDNDPSIHKEQEIFSCECHANPHNCKSHPLTSKSRETWEFAQSGLFLFRELINHRYGSKKSSLHQSVSLDSHIYRIVTQLLSLVSTTKLSFSKYSTWMTSLVSNLNSIFLTLPLNASLETPDWATAITPLLVIIEKQEAISASAVSMVKGGPSMGASPFYPHFGPMAGPFPSAASSSSSQMSVGVHLSSTGSHLPIGHRGGMGSIPFTPSHPSPPFTIPSGTPNYAAAIKPSLAKASSSMLLIDACNTLLSSLYLKLGKHHFTSFSNPSHQSIFKRKCLPIINESSIRS